MAKKYRLIVSILMLAIIFFGVIIHYKNDKSNNIQSGEVIEVGVYEYDPCYYISDDNQIEGYYNDVLQAIDKYDGSNYIYNYSIDSFDESLKKLESGEIDLMIGISKTKERESKFIYSDMSIGVERYGLYSNDVNLRYADLEAIEGLSVGVVKGGTNGEYIKKVFSDNGIIVDIKEFKEQPNMIKSFIKGDLDLSIQPIGRTNYGRLVYEYSTGPVYIAVSKGNEELIKHINDTLINNQEEISIILNKSYRKQFNYKDEENNLIFTIITYGLWILGTIILFIIISKKDILKTKYIQMRIRRSISNNEYLLYYQPIYNPKNKEIVGLESLLRKKDKYGNILSPDKFLAKIEDNNMIYEISLWILEKVIKEYKITHEKLNLRGEKYISINISVNEIMNDNFIDECCYLIKKYNIPRYKICLELIERVKSENTELLKKYVNKLKEAGFLIAIDDFGMEYSNLHLLENIDFDIIKLDKYFIDNISKIYIKEEILKFLSSLSKRGNATLVVEGVENKNQNDLIKRIDNEKVYAQGYYFSRPMSIEDIL